MAQERLTIIVNAMTGQASRELRKLDAELAKADKTTQGLRGTFNRVGSFVKANAAAIAAGVGTAAVAIGASAVKAASDLEEVQNKSKVIFGSASRDIEEFAETAAQRLGQSQRAALDAASTFGIFGQSAGLTGKKLSGFSTDLTSLASDLASFNNTSPEDAVTALGAALRGESEPIRRYGVLLDDATLRNRALQLGLIETTRQALTPQQRVLAAYNEILSQTTLQQGDFARTSDSLANKQRVLQANWENLRAELGQNLLPVVIEVTDRLNRLVGAAAEGDKGGWFSAAAENLKDLAQNVLFEPPRDLADWLAGPVPGVDSAPGWLDWLATFGDDAEKQFYKAGNGAQVYIQSLYDMKRRAEEGAIAQETAENRIARLEKAAELAADKVKKLADAQKAAREELQKSFDLYAELGDAVIDADRAYRDLQEAVESYNAIPAENAKKQEAALRDVGRATLSLNEAYQDLADTRNDSEASALDIQRAEARVVDAQEALRRTQDALRSSTEGYASAVDDVLDATLRNATALADADARQKEANSTQQTALEKWNLTTRAILQQAADLEGPARTALLNHIATVNGIPAEKVTEIEALVDQGSVNRAFGVVSTLSAPVTKVIRLAVDFSDYWAARNVILGSRLPVNGQVQMFAAGGRSAGGLAIVGEEGPELVKLPTGTRVWSHDETMAMARSLPERNASSAASGSPVFNISVDATGATDPRAVGKAVVDALAAWTRSGNRIPSSWVAA